MMDNHDTDGRVGTVVGGGLQGNLKIELSIPVENVRLGEYLMLQGDRQNYFAAVTDVAFPPSDQIPLSEDWSNAKNPTVGKTVQRLLARSQVEAMVGMAQQLDSQGQPVGEPLPAATIPPLGSPVRSASAQEMTAIYGGEDSTHMVIGHSGSGIPICVDLDALVTRPSAIYGSTGTGKSTAVKVILAGLIQRKMASLLVMDMHNDYGHDDYLPDGRIAPGLKDAFPEEVVTYGLGPVTTVRGRRPDELLILGYDDVAPRDIMRLAELLSLTDNTPTVFSALTRAYKGRWLAEFLHLTVADLASPDKALKETLGLPAKSLLTAEALRGKLAQIDGLDYLQDRPGGHALKDIIQHLEQGRTVVLSFGDNTRELDYLLVANVLTRHITRVWDERANRRRSSGTGEAKPLVIVQEEAHLLLNRDNALMTPYGTIAREKRKSNLTLMLIDQRPSGIWDEVASQVGTRICFWLGDDKDVNSALAGLPNRDGLKKMLTALRPSQECLLMGYGVRMPIAIRTREYSRDCIQEIKGATLGTQPLNQPAAGGLVPPEDGNPIP